MWENIDAQWQKLVWGRKSRRNKQGGVILEEVRIDLRHVATGEIVHLIVTTPPEGDLERESDLAVQRHFATCASRVPAKSEVEDLLREKQRLEGELEAVLLRLEGVRELVKGNVASSSEVSEGKPL